MRSIVTKMTGCVTTLNVLSSLTLPLTVNQERMAYRYLSTLCVVARPKGPRPDYQICPNCISFRATPMFLKLKVTRRALVQIGFDITELTPRQA